MEEEMIEDYETIKSVLIEKKARKEKRLEEEKAEYKRLKEIGTAISDFAFKSVKTLIISIENELLQINAQLEYLRPVIDEDKEYRLRQYHEFQNKMKELIPDNLQLRFHGCPIYTAKQIIKSGEIISSVDRIGLKTSYDEDGEISVTTKKDVGASVGVYANLKNSFCLPAGCIFVLFPENEGDALLSERRTIMNNVNFKNNPERLYAILTTPENIKRVNEWCGEAGIDLGKIYDFDEFSKKLEETDVVQDAVETWKKIKNKNNKGSMVTPLSIKNIDEEER